MYRCTKCLKSRCQFLKTLKKAASHHISLKNQSKNYAAYSGHFLHGTVYNLLFYKLFYRCCSTDFYKLLLCKTVMLHFFGCEKYFGDAHNKKTTSNDN